MLLAPAGGGGGGRGLELLLGIDQYTPTEDGAPDAGRATPRRTGNPTEDGHRIRNRMSMSVCMPVVCVSCMYVV